MVVSNQELLTRGDRKYAAKKGKKQGEAAVYDPDARSEYLSGFHKRKVRRQEEAKKKAAEWEKTQRQKEKQQISAEKKKVIQRGLERLQDAQKIFNGESLDSGDEKSDNDNDGDNDNDDDEEEFHGFEDSSGILKKQDYGDEQVTFEQIRVDPYVDLSKGAEVLDSSTRRAHEYADYVERAEKEQERQHRQRVRKKKFRYRR